MAAACSLGPSIPVHLDKTDEEIEMEHAGGRRRRRRRGRGGGSKRGGRAVIRLT